MRRKLLSNGYTLSVGDDENVSGKDSVGWLHNNVRVTNASEWYTCKWLKLKILYCVDFITVFGGKGLRGFAQL